MPVVLRVGAYRLFFYSNEGDPLEPVHIHVRRDRAIAKLWLNPVEIVDCIGFNMREQGEIIRIVRDHQRLIEDSWHDYFG